MSVKKYTSKTCLAVNVVLASGKSLHISFSPLTGGGSVYYTDNADIQRALEHHVSFGGIFHIDNVEQEEAIPAPEAEPKSNAVNVESLDDAKDYLGERFGVSRTKMKGGVEGVKAIAAKYGVTFEGI